MLQKCFTLPILPLNAYFHSVCLDSRFFVLSVCCNICLEKEIQLVLGESYMFADVIMWYVQ